MRIQSPLFFVHYQTRLASVSSTGPERAPSQEAIGDFLSRIPEAAGRVNTAKEDNHAGNRRSTLTFGAICAILAQLTRWTRDFPPSNTLSGSGRAGQRRAGRFPSGQRELTVNQSRNASEVRILLSPPNRAVT